MSTVNVRVICRFRPQNRRELGLGAREIVTFLDENTTVHIKGDERADHKFTFDRVFPPGESQRKVYEDAAENTVKDIFKGYNGTLFAYGQTGSGKTHTMMGPDGGKGMDDPEMKGVIPRMVKTIFELIEVADENIEFLVKVSYIEIYLEKIRDLLDGEKDNLRVREDQVRGIWVEGATEVYVNCEEDVMDVIRCGTQNRAIAATEMNAESSRSHSMVIVQVQQKNLQSGSLKTGKLYLVDLAGSEKVEKTGASGTTLDEAKMINKSLSALGNVINALTDSKSKHIPYRDSKLTRILQESLGGNSRTTLIINCSPSSFNEAETLSTLRFGSRAKNIQNKAKVNQERSMEEMKALLQAATKEVAHLKNYVKGLEEELRYLRGDTPTVVPKSAAPVADSDTSSKPSAGDTTSTTNSNPAAANLPDVERMHAEYTEVEKKLEEAQKEQARLLDIQDRLVDQIQEREAADEERERVLTELTATHERSLVRQDELQRQNKILIRKIAEMKVQQETTAMERTDSDLTVQSLRSRNELLQQELEELQTALTHLQTSSVESEEGDELRALGDDSKRSSSMPPHSGGTGSAEQGTEGSGGNAGVVGDPQAGSGSDEQLQKENELLRKRIKHLEAQHTAMTSAAETALAESESDPETLPEKHRQLAAMYASLKQESATRLEEFNVFKTALLRDLQNRCEKVIDLELLLEEARTQYMDLVTKSNVKALQRKITFLQKNSEVLTLTQHKTLNALKSEKLEKLVVTQKLAAREERMKKLEQRLSEERDDHERKQAQLEASLEKVKTELATLRAAPRSPMGTRRVAMPMRGGQSRRRSNSVKDGEEDGEGGSKRGFFNRFRSSNKVAMPMRGKGAVKPSSSDSQ